MDTPPLIAKLVDHIKWTAQTVHQAHHLEQTGTWETCPRATCNAAAVTLWGGPS